MATADSNQQPCAELELGYQTTLMYGRYTRSLGEYAKEQAAELCEFEKRRKKEEKERIKELRVYRGKWTSRFLRVVSFIWRHTFAKIGEDWVFLALLGIIMAVISFAMDYGISVCNTARFWMFNELATAPLQQYLAWISLPVFLVLFSAGFVYILAPQAIGSGIPEMKTILRGVVLKEYLTFRTLIAKVVGLTASLGSGMPLGKEGPLVHIASIVATLMSKMVTSFKGIYENESRNSEMLAAACAVGVSCCVGAPIGGVLFSIEVTSVYFAIRNYWRGFFSAVFGALMFRLLAYWFDTEETLTAMFRTNFRVDFAYDPHELFIYALIGAFGGLSGALFVLCHRKYVLFMRKNKKISAFLQKNRFIYPGVVSLFIASLYFPLGLGQFLASTLTTRQQIISLFSNFTWMSDDLTVEQAAIVNHWTNPYCNIFVNLSIYMVTTFFLTVLASTLPVPSGSLIPIFKIGAAFGRIIGEAMHLWFPEGLRIGVEVASILPGGYAIVGAAAFSAGVTHSISICVVVSEMTGQIYHIIPVLVAVLVSNAISTLLQPSLYDSIIMIKKLPYLPDILPSSNAAYNIFVENFMVRNIKYIWKKMSYEELKNILKENQKIHSFPLVDDPSHMILLGSIQRNELVDLIERHICHERRIKVAVEWETATHSLNSEEIKPFQLDPPPIRTCLPTVVVTESSSHEPVQRQSSRFEVVKAPDVFVSQTVAATESQRSQERQLMTLLPSPEPLTPVSIQSNDADDMHERRPKSILKKTNSFTFPQVNQPETTIATNLLTITPHSTVHSTEGSKFRQAFGAFIRKSSSVLDGGRFHFSHGGLSPCSPNHLKKVTLPKVIDMTPDAKKEWEESEMQKPIDLRKCRVDPAPFQLVERTSLLKVHSMFSLLGVQRAYVTTIGQLIGIVSLTELRKAIEDVNCGNLPGLPQNSSSLFNQNESDSNPNNECCSSRDQTDIESGPETPGLTDSDLETSNSSELSSPTESVSSVQTTVIELSCESLSSMAKSVAGTNKENCIKLIVSAPSTPGATTVNVIHLENEPERPEVKNNLD